MYFSVYVTCNFRMILNYRFVFCLVVFCFLFQVLCFKSCKWIVLMKNKQSASLTVVLYMYAL